MPTLYLLVGLPCSGKTTLAKKLESDFPALRLTPDEWMRPLYGADLDTENASQEFDAKHDSVELVMWQVAERALNLSVDVILDFGCWTKSEREAFRKKAAAVGADTKIVFLDVPLDELKRRAAARNENLAPGQYRITGEELDKWHGLFEKPDKEELS
jgi:predicted kinase